MKNGSRGINLWKLFISETAKPAQKSCNTLQKSQWWRKSRTIYTIYANWNFSIILQRATKQKKNYKSTNKKRFSIKNSKNIQVAGESEGFVVNFFVSEFQFFLCF